MTAVHVYYAGRVQGVGFRYTATEIAGRFAVAGWVKNLPDGRVEVLAEGESAEVSAFLAAVSERFRRNIQSEDRTPTSPSGEIGFRIER